MIGTAGRNFLGEGRRHTPAPRVHHPLHRRPAPFSSSEAVKKSILSSPRSPRPPRETGSVQWVTIFVGRSFAVGGSEAAKKLRVSSSVPKRRVPRRRGRRVLYL